MTTRSAAYHWSYGSDSPLSECPLMSRPSPCQILPLVSLSIAAIVNSLVWTHVAWPLSVNVSVRELGTNVFWVYQNGKQRAERFHWNVYVDVALQDVYSASWGMESSCRAKTSTNPLSGVCSSNSIAPPLTWPTKANRRDILFGIWLQTESPGTRDRYVKLLEFRGRRHSIKFDVCRWLWTGPTLHLHVYWEMERCGMTCYHVSSIKWLSTLTREESNCLACMP